jgi:hypothetical protein
MHQTPLGMSQSNCHTEILCRLCRHQYKLLQTLPRTPGYSYLSLDVPQVLNKLTSLIATLPAPCSEHRQVYMVSTGMARGKGKMLHHSWGKNTGIHGFHSRSYDTMKSNPTSCSPSMRAYHCRLPAPVPPRHRSTVKSGTPQCFPNLQLCLPRTADVTQQLRVVA